MERRRIQGEAPERAASGVLIARQLGLQALWTTILGFRAEKGHAVRIKRHGRREGAGEGAGAEAAPGLPLWHGGGCWERLLPLGLGVGQLAAAGQALVGRAAGPTGHGLPRRLGQGAGGAGQREERGQAGPWLGKERGGLGWAPAAGWAGAERRGREC